MKKRKRIQKVMTTSTSKRSDTLPEEQPIVNEPKQSFTHEQLLNALYWIHDVMDRASVPFFLVKETAECMMNNTELSGEAVHVGVRHNVWYTGSLNIIEAFALAEERTKEAFKYTYEKVPVIVHIYKDHQCITGLNTRMYMREDFNLPNPYSQFLEIYT